MLKRRENWEVQVQCAAGYTEIFLTDCLKMEQGSGARVYLLSENQRWAFRLGLYATVLQAEVYPILRAPI